MNIKNISLLLFMALCPVVLSAQKYLSTDSPEITKKWNDHIFSSNKTFSQNIATAPEFSILNKTLKEKALSEAIAKEEMVTIFAFTDEAFTKMNKKKRDSVVSNKKVMTSIVKIMTIPGRIDKNSLQIAVKKHDGKAYLTTLNGEYLGVTQKDGNLFLIDSEGRMAAITATNFYHKNGLFHIVDGVIFPTPAESK